jgi:hypothetical protein
MASPTLLGGIVLTLPAHLVVVSTHDALEPVCAGVDPMSKKRGCAGSQVGITARLEVRCATTGPDTSFLRPFQNSSNPGFAHLRQLNRYDRRPAFHPKARRYRMVRTCARPAREHIEQLRATPAFSLCVSRRCREDRAQHQNCWKAWIRRPPRP